jgi:hypothetical protein
MDKVKLTIRKIKRKNWKIIPHNRSTLRLEDDDGKFLQYIPLEQYRDMMEHYYKSKEFEEEYKKTFGKLIEDDLFINEEEDEE